MKRLSQGSLIMSEPKLKGKEKLCPRVDGPGLVCKATSEVIEETLLLGSMKEHRGKIC